MTTDKTAGKGLRPGLLRDALVRDLARRDRGDDGATAARMRLVAKRLVDKAMAGDLAAIRLVLDRVDGRPSAGPRRSESAPMMLCWMMDEETEAGDAGRHGCVAFAPQVGNEERPIFPTHSSHVAENGSGFGECLSRHAQDAGSARFSAPIARIPLNEAEDSASVLRVTRANRTRARSARPKTGGDER